MGTIAKGHVIVNVEKKIISVHVDTYLVQGESSLFRVQQL